MAQRIEVGVQEGQKDSAGEKVRDQIISELGIPVNSVNVLVMPHPERFLTPYTHPLWTRMRERGELPAEGAGLAIFRNAVRYFE